MVKKRNKDAIQFIIIAISLIVILVGLFFWSKYAAEKTITKDYYNEYPFYFEESQNIWITQIQVREVPYNIQFHHHPIEVEDIIVEENIEDIILRNKPENIIITIPGDSDAKIGLAGIEISKITGERFKLLRIPTTSAVNEKIEGLPFATCQDANEKTVVISFKRSDKNLISSQDRCIILEFKENESIRVADAFVYNLIKIM